MGLNSSKDQASRKKDIAIIGISGRYPNTESLKSFWESLTEGKELIKFFTEEELETLSGSQKENQNYVAAESRFDYGGFDYNFFGYTRDEAELMDPQIRIMHECVYEALQDSGYTPESTQHKIGLFLAAGDNLNWEAYAFSSGSEAVNPFFLGRIANKNYINTLISYNLNLQGPSYYIDTACSSSLVSVHIACRNLLMRECAIAVAGGISVYTGTQRGYSYEEGLIFSKDGHCRAFDKDASGTVGADGAGVVVLKRYEEAVKDGDRIYGIIKATAVNNDGKRKVGYTAPSVRGQIECIKTALKIADVDPGTIAYVEAHGTGTRLGDPIELKALNEVFKGAKQASCALGTVKSNMGHCDAAAGITGLIKTALMLHRKTLVPSLHYKSPNPEINFESGPFYVNTETKHWKSQDNYPLRAGVSSFGIGGTNAHAILEEAEAVTPGQKKNQMVLLPFSAKTKEALEKYKVKLTDHFRSSEQVDLTDAAFTLATGRTHYHHRAFLIASDPEDAVPTLNGKGNGFLRSGYAEGNREVVFMFSGSGSQYLNMSKGLYQSNPMFAIELDKGLTELEELTGTSYRSILFNETDLGSENPINNNLYTQPLLYVFEVALARFLIGYGIIPARLIGHSTGEYSAACIAGVFSFTEGLQLVVKRAELMSKAPSGSMLSVHMPKSQIQRYLSESISLAAVNSPEHCVLSGYEDAINQLIPILESDQVNYSKLRVSVAGHSHLMEPILEAYKEVLSTVRFHEPEIEIISNVTGLPLTAAECQDKAYWINHLREPVLFSDGLQFILKKGDSVLFEIGPGNVLSTFFNLQKDHSSLALNLIRHHDQQVDDQEFFLQRLGEAWLCGTEIPLNNLLPGQGKRISMPFYAFEREDLAFRVDSFANAGFTQPDSTAKPYKDWFYKPFWREYNPAIKEALPIDQVDWILCFTGNDSTSALIEQKLIETGKKVVFVKQEEYDSSNQFDFQTVKDKLSAFDGTNGRIVFSRDLDENQINEAYRKSLGNYNLLLTTLRELHTEATPGSLEIIYVSKNVFQVYGTEVLVPENSLIAGALRVIPKEYENVTCRMIDLDNEPGNRELAVELIMAPPSEEEFVALRNRKIWSEIYERVPLSANLDSIPGKEDVYLVTGAGGMATTLVNDLLAKGSKVIVCSRSECSNKFDSPDEESKTRLCTFQNDLQDLSKLRQAISEGLEHLKGRLAGVFHTAGLGDYAGLIKDRKIEDCESIFAPKVAGTTNLYEATQPLNPDFFLICSSISALQAPFGNVAYAAANSFQNAFASSREAQERVVSILWDTWKQTGMGITSRQRNENKKIEELEDGITNEEGLQIFYSAANLMSGSLVVSRLNLDLVLEHSKQFTVKRVLDYTEQSESENRKRRPEMLIPYVAPENDIQEKLCEIWQKYLGFDRIGIRDDFFELGMDSLKMMMIVRIIQKEFGVSMGLKELYKKPNILGVAEEIEVALVVKNITADQTKGNEIII